jgi:tyrosine decarboxylase / aspartate 1-decarboxylase
LHLGEISLECSRPGAAAAALWATQKLLPLVRQGEFACGLEIGRAAALGLYDLLQKDTRFVTAFGPELDIVVFAPRANSVSEASARTRRIFQAAARRNLHLAVAELPVEFWATTLGGIKRDKETMTCLRSVLMKPEHLEWLPRIWEALSQATAEVLEAESAVGVG